MKLDPIGALFSKSWERYRGRFTAIFSIFILPIVLILIGELVLAQRTLPAAALGFLIALIGVIVAVAASLAMVAAVGKGEDFFAAYKTGFTLFWASIWMAILSTLAYFGGLILLVIPGIMIAVQLSLAQYVLVMENKGGMMALAQSREYIKGYWWAFFGRTLLLGLVYAAALLILYLPAKLIFGGIGAAIAYIAILIFFTPFSIAYVYEIFDNFRRMKPNAAEAAAKAEKGFLKVCMVLGVIEFIGFIVLIFAGAVFLPGAVKNWRAANPNGNVYIQTNPDGSQTAPITKLL